MARRRRPPDRTTASAKLTPDKHQALIDKWNALPPGKRQGWLIEAMSEKMQREATGSATLSEQLASIRQMVAALPGNIQEMLKHISVASAEPVAEEVAGGQTAEEMAARDAAMAKGKWNRF